MNELNQISAKEIGRRLRIARENANINQEDAAKVIGLSRPTLVSIEKGTRRVRIQELQVLATEYGTTVNAILRREAVHTDLVPRFRRLMENEDAYTREAVQLLSELVKADVELENVLGIQTHRPYPPELGISAGDVSELADEHAQGLRDWLGIGNSPISDIFSLIEVSLGIRLYQRRLSSRSRVSGMFAYDEAYGACILLNANHPWERRVHSAAHELGHFVGTRRNPEVLEENERFLSREERYANAFGRAFLTPKESFSKSFENLTEGANKLTRRHVVLLANQFGVSRQACVLRLEELGLVRKGSWGWFDANGGITDETVKSVLGEKASKSDLAKADADRAIPLRLSLRAFEVWNQELMSEGQLAELLKVPRIKLREVLDEIATEERFTDDVLRLGQ